MPSMPASRCVRCRETIADLAWPAAGSGSLCQGCWETESSEEWWEMLRRLEGIPALTTGRE